MIIITMLKYILYFFNIKLPDDASPFIEIAFSTAMLSLVILLCFINVFGYLIAIYLVKYYNIENKYPKFKWLINYYIRFSVTNIVIEAIIGFGFLIIMIVLGFYPLYKVL
jgi:hypothetical protein